MALKNNDENKWTYSEHAQVKHTLMKKYLEAWIPILGSNNDTIMYVDGFAGRGQYANGSDGSPLLAMQACQEVSHFKSVRNLKFICYFVERDKDNYDNLVEVVTERRKDFPSVHSVFHENKDFDTAINELLDKTKDNLVPSFFFIDPFGYTGVPFETVKRILSIPRTEVFFNFMFREMNRFLSVKHQEKNFDTLFGCSEWKEYIDLSGTEREHALRNLYMRRLIEENCAKYVFPFRICEDSKCSTLYYLIYATNHFKGLAIMKSIMFNQNEHYAYLGPKELQYQESRSQLRLFDPNVESLKTYLMKFFPKGKRITYDNILENTFILTQSVEKHYREALKTLEKEGKIAVKRITSKTPRGLSGNDIIIF
ncbi:MAG: three-Cys-motif partner protein TcmP [Caulobacteraceae bacterium]